jgi:hypothetical protein
MGGVILRERRSTDSSLYHHTGCPSPTSQSMADPQTYARPATFFRAEHPEHSERPNTNPMGRCPLDAALALLGKTDVLPSAAYRQIRPNPRLIRVGIGAD